MFELTPLFYGRRSLAAYDPFKEMEELERRFFGRQAPAFQTDIRETEKAYVLEAALPGFAKEDISAEICDGVLTLRAERKAESDQTDEGGRYIRRERSYGSFVRRFDLEGIQADGITASYENGILSLTLPKEEKKLPEGRRVEIR